MAKTIKYKVQFKEGKALREQDLLFIKWVEENAVNKINRNTKPDSVDPFGRPSSYTVVLKGAKVIVIPIYRFDSSDPAIVDYNITIK